MTWDFVTLEASIMMTNLAMTLFFLRKLAEVRAEVGHAVQHLDARIDELQGVVVKSLS